MNISFLHCALHSQKSKVPSVLIRKHALLLISLGLIWSVMARADLAACNSDSFNYDLCRAEADRENAEAQYLLGKWAQDQQAGIEARKWYLKAAAHGHAGAQFELGELSMLGTGAVPRDHLEAANWYRKAADQGMVVAQIMLGTMYAEDDVLPKDYVQAYLWLSLARNRMEKAGKPWEQCCQYLLQFYEELESKLTPEQLEQARQLLRHWHPSIGTK